VEEAQVNLLGTLPECDPLSHASAINGRGSVVGGINGPAQFNVHAFVWRPGSGIIEIPGLDVGSRFAAAINDQDQVVGTAPIDGRLGAFTWDPRSGTRPLEVLPGSQETYAVDINDQGWIAGNAKTSSGETHPLLWKPGAPVRDLGLTSGYTTGYASHLNERAQVLVTFERPTGPRSKTLEAPYVWSESEGFVAVPLPQGFQDVRAMALNDLGHVLLSGRRIGTGEDAGFLVVNGQLKPLPPSRLGASTRYNGFNNKGWLTGFVEPQEGGLDTRARRGFVARP
jgi:probable HAF family extracellular repeat protein